MAKNPKIFANLFIYLIFLILYKIGKIFGQVGTGSTFFNRRFNFLTIFGNFRTFLHDFHTFFTICSQNVHNLAQKLNSHCGQIFFNFWPFAQIFWPFVGSTPKSSVQLYHFAQIFWPFAQIFLQFLARISMNLTIFVRTFPQISCNFLPKSFI